MSKKWLAGLATVTIVGAALLSILSRPEGANDRIQPDANGSTLTGLSAHYEIHNTYGEGIALACQHGRPAVVLVFDSRIRTRKGEYVFIDIDDRRWDDEQSKYKDLTVYTPVISNGDDGKGVILKAQNQEAAKIVKFVSESAKLHFRIEEKYGSLVKSQFRLTRDDQLGAANILNKCPVRPA